MCPITGDPSVTLLNTQPLLSRLGVKGIAQLTFDPRIVPVAVVDGSIQAVGLQTLDIPFTAGELTAPAANTRLATGPPLTAGQYNLSLMVGLSTEANSFRLRRRNAADSADVWAMRFNASPTAYAVFWAARVNVLAGEFFVVENVLVGGAGQVYQASLWFQGPF